jgi:hypothetical protein
MTGLEHARDAIDIVAATVCAVAIVVRGVFVEDLVDGRAPTRRVNFTEAVRKMAGSPQSFRLIARGQLWCAKSVR